MNSNETFQLIAWVKGGEYRIRILKLLANKKMLPSEIAKAINNHRSTTSRILKDLRNKNLVDYATSESRTKLYFLTTKGEELINGTTLD